MASMDEVQVQKRLARRIVELRQAAGMTQDDLAAATGLTVEAISRLERAQRPPRLGTLVKLAEGFDIAIAELFNTNQDRGQAIARRDVAALALALRNRPAAEVRLVSRIAEVIASDQE